MRAAAAALFVLASGPSWSAGKEPGEAPLLRSRPERLLLNEVLELEPAAGHHFNLKAPQRCGDSPLLKLTPRLFRCQPPSPGRVRVAASVCDDAVTFCRTERFEVEVAAPGGRGKARVAAAAPGLRLPEGGKRAPKGFMDDPKLALQEARARSALLFIHFGAIWCPPCNMLEELAYPDGGFLEATSGMVRVRLDADSESSWDWKARFKVRGYPTLVIADGRLREIGRLVSYRPAKPLIRWVRAMKELRGEPVEEALKRAKKSPGREAARKRIGLWRYERYEFDQAIGMLAGLKDPEARKYELLSRKEKAKREDEDASARAAALKSLVSEFPGDVEYVYWVVELLELDKAYALGLLEEARKSVESWAASETLEETMSNPGYLWGDLAELLETAGDPEGAKPFYAKAVGYFEAMASRSSLKVSRGPNLTLAWYLWKSGRPEKAKALYDSLVGAYDGEFTFHHDYGELLYGLKEHEKAREQAAKAEAASYGDNRLRAAELKAKAELALRRPEAARATLEEAVSGAVLPKSLDVRTHRYLAKLRKLLEEAKAGRSGTASP